MLADVLLEKCLARSMNDAPRVLIVERISALLMDSEDVLLRFLIIKLLHQHPFLVVYHGG